MGSVFGRVLPLVLLLDSDGSCCRAGGAAVTPSAPELLVVVVLLLGTDFDMSEWPENLLDVGPGPWANVAANRGMAGKPTARS